MAKQNNQRN